MAIGLMFLIITLGSILIAENLKYGFQVTDKKSEESVSTKTRNSIDSTEGFNLIELNPTKKELLKTCPSGFTYYVHLGIPFCYILTEKQPHPTKCPYKNYMEDDTITEIYNNFQNITIWANAKRNMHKQFGEFEWLDMSTRYLDTITDYKISNGTVSDKNCMVLFNHTLIAVSCAEEYPTLCIYNYHGGSIGKYCSKHNRFIDCVSVDLNTDNRCYCRATTTGLKVFRNTFCQKFAEPDPFQNNLLLTQLSYSRPCWFGIEQNNGVLQWSSTKDPIDYGFWSSNANFSKEYAAFDYKKANWFLENDRSLECAICQITVKPQNVSIHLKYLPDSNEIEITIDNIFELHNNLMPEYILACFSDYDSTTIKKRITSSVLDLIPITSPLYIKKIAVENLYPAYYWCQSIQRPSFTPVLSNKILAYKDTGKHNHEYALTVEVPVSDGDDPYLKQLHVVVTDVVSFHLSSKFDFINVARPIKIATFSEELHTMVLLIHISVAKNNLTAVKEYNNLLESLQVLPESQPKVVSKIVTFYRSEVCLQSTTVSQNLTLHWPESFVGKTVIPTELCLLDNSLPVTRTCLGDFDLGAYWSNPDGNCSNKDISDRTLNLYTILNVETEEGAISQGLLNVTDNSNNVLVIDVHLISEILEHLQKISKHCLVEVVNIISNIMYYQGRVLQNAQVKLNSTDITLHALDIILINSKITYKENIRTVLTKKVIVQVSYLSKSVITGSVLYSLSNYSGEDFEGFNVKPLYTTTIDELLKQDFELSVVASEELMKEIKGKYVDITNDFIVSFFRNDVLFNYDKKPNNESHMVLSVIMPNLINVFKNPIYTIHKLHHQYNSYNCSYWKYGVTDNEQHVRGKWVVEGPPNIKHGKNHYAICTYHHATHYALLMSTRDLHKNQTPQIRLALNIITLIGCGLSLVGLTGIFVIALFYRHWMKRTKNKIMINFSIALAAQTIFLFISDSINQNTTKCIIVGASLHYTILSVFAWMVIVAILQYRKLVLVFEQRVQYFLTKCLLFGWCLPSVPVLVILTAFPESYNQNTNGICYPEGNIFYYSIVLPISVFVLINLFVFVKILINIFTSKVEKYGAHVNEIKLHVSVAIILFFLLGITWLFGIGITFTNDTILSFIFCFTATLQGVVMFIFFILINKESRALWLNIKSVLMCAQNKPKF